MKYIKGFDTLRAVAVFFVIVEHWGPSFKEHTASADIKSAFILNGQFGVNLFFVLSGFLISSILLHEKIKNIEGKNFTIIKNFFARRILRIFPIYYLFILICYLADYTFVREHIWYYLTYTSNFISYYSNSNNVLAHTWSLAVEEQFYLIWPWLIILINRKYLKYVFLLAFLTGIITTYMALFMYSHPYPFLVVNCMDAFGIGALYAYVRMDKEKCLQFENIFKPVFIIMLFFAWRIALYNGAPICIMYSKVFNDVIALALIMFAINCRPGFVKNYILENKFLNFIGKISYGIYLYHYTFGPFYDYYIPGFIKDQPSMPAIFSNFYFSYCVKLILLVGISWVSFRFFEQPILRLKKKFEYTK